MCLFQVFDDAFGVVIVVGGRVVEVMGMCYADSSRGVVN